MTYWDTRLAVFDLETTGVDTDTSRIVSACIARARARRLAARRSGTGSPIPGSRSPRAPVRCTASPPSSRAQRVAPPRRVAGEITATIRTLLAARHPARRLQRALRPLAARPRMPPPPHRAARLAVAGHRPARHRQGRRPLPQGQAHADRGGRALRREPRRRARCRRGCDRGRARRAGARAHLPRRGRRAVRRPARPAADLVRRAGGELPAVHPRGQGRSGLRGRVRLAVAPARRPDDVRRHHAAADAEAAAERDDPDASTSARRSRSRLRAPPTGARSRRSRSSSSSTRSSRSRSRSTCSTSRSVDPIVIDTIDARRPAPSMHRSRCRPRRSSSPWHRSRRADRKPHIIRIAAAVVTDIAGRSLLVRKRGSSIFMQPGGKIESGESALDALDPRARAKSSASWSIPARPSTSAVTAPSRRTKRTRSCAPRCSSSPTPASFRSQAPRSRSCSGSSASISSRSRLAPLSRDSLLPLWAVHAERRSSPARSIASDEHAARRATRASGSPFFSAVALRSTCRSSCSAS